MTVADDTRRVLAALPGPVYAAAGHALALGGWISDGVVTAAITLRQEGHLADAGPVLDIETLRDRRGDDPAAVAARTLRDAIANSDGGGSPGSWARRVADARADVVGISVDGTARPFERLVLGALWSAARLHGEVVIAICARVIAAEDLRLRRLSREDLEGALRPRRPPGP